MSDFLKYKFCEGVTIALATRSAGLDVKRGFTEKDRTVNTVRALYQHETGKDPNGRFLEGLGRMQWEYGIRGTAYYAKDKRAAVLAYMGADQ